MQELHRRLRESKLFGFVAGGGFSLGIVLLLIKTVPYLTLHRMLGVDDAYMFVRYADNIIQHGLFAWNVVDGSQFGCTSVSYTLWITVLRFLFPNAAPQQLLVGSSFVFALLALLLMWQMIRLLTRTTKLEHPLFAMGMLAPIVLHDAFRNNAVNGMDTMLSLSCNVAFLISLQRFTFSSGTAIISAALGWLCIATRPDAAIVVLGSSILLVALQTSHRNKNSLIFFVMLALMLGSSAFVAHSVFGDVLPNTFYVKQQGFYKGFIGILHMNTLASTLSFMLMLSPLIVVTLLSIRGTSLAIVSSYALPLLFALLWLIGVVQIMGEHLRFYVPFIPLVLISSLLALRHADLNQEELRKSLVRGMPLVLAFLYLFAFPQSTQTFFERVIAAQELRDVQADPTPTNCVGNYTVNGCDAWQATLAIDSLCNEVPSIHTLACSEYGYLAAFHPQLRIVDMVGLHDREMAHQGFNSAHILSQKPQVIWMPHSDYTWLRAELMRDSVFVHEYSYYKGAFCFGVAIRNDDKLIRPKLEEHLQRWYGSGASK